LNRTVDIKGGIVMNHVLMNHDLVPRDEAAVDIEDRGYQFGDGVYEVVRIFKGKSFTMDEHLERLERSAKEIQLTLPYDREELKSKLEELRSINAVKDGIIYIQISRGVLPRTHGFPSPEVPPQLVACTKEMKRPLAFQQKGISAILTEDIRWLRCDIKSLNLLGNVLAKQKAADQNCFEAIFHRGETVTEGSSTNVFLIKDGILYTHPATNLILNGITRRKVLEISHQLELRVKEEQFTVQELLAGDEVFITSTTNDIMPVIKIDEQEIGAGSPGQITVRLQEAFNELIANS
jgi:D-alanine transaminase